MPASSISGLEDVGTEAPVSVASHGSASTESPPLHRTTAEDIGPRTRAENQQLDAMRTAWESEWYSHTKRACQQSSTDNNPALNSHPRQYDFPNPITPSEHGCSIVIGERLTVDAMGQAADITTLPTGQQHDQPQAQPAESWSVARVKRSEVRRRSMTALDQVKWPLQAGSDRDEAPPAAATIRSWRDFHDSTAFCCPTPRATGNRPLRTGSTDNRINLRCVPHTQPSLDNKVETPTEEIPDKLDESEAWAAYLRSRFVAMTTRINEQETTILDLAAELANERVHKREQEEEALQSKLHELRRARIPAACSRSSSSEDTRSWSGSDSHSWRRSGSSSSGDTSVEHTDSKKQSPQAAQRPSFFGQMLRRLSSQATVSTTSQVSSVTSPGPHARPFFAPGSPLQQRAGYGTPETQAEGLKMEVLNLRQRMESLELMMGTRCEKS